MNVAKHLSLSNSNMKPVKYISVHTKCEVDCEVPLVDLVNLHNIGYGYTRLSMVYESDGINKLSRPLVGSDLLYSYIGTFVDQVHDLKFKIYKSDEGIVSCFDKIKYIKSMCNVCMHDVSMLDTSIQHWLNLNSTSFYDVESLVINMFISGLYDIEINNISLCSNVILKNGTIVSLFKFLFNVKYFVYNILEV